MIAALLATLIAGFVDPFYAKLAEDSCLAELPFAGTEDYPIGAHARYETFVHTDNGVPDEKLGVDERIVVVDVEVIGTSNGLCRLHCAWWHCVYPTEVICWRAAWDRPAGCSSQHILVERGEAENRTSCAGGVQWL